MDILVLDFDSESDNFCTTKWHRTTIFSLSIMTTFVFIYPIFTAIHFLVYFTQNGTTGICMSIWLLQAPIYQGLWRLFCQTRQTKRKKWIMWKFTSKILIRFLKFCLKSIKIPKIICSKFNTSEIFAGLIYQCIFHYILCHKRTYSYYFIEDCPI